MIDLKWDSSLRRQTYSLPDLLLELYGKLEDQAKALACEESIRAADKVMLTGCGDSNAAGMAVKYALAEFLQVPVEVVPTVDFCRCMPEFLLTPKTLVIAISVSGNGARIEEAVDRANRAGAVTLGVTRDAASGVGTRVKNALLLPIPAFERGPGNRNYFACVLALLLFGIRLGEMRGNYSGEQGERYRQAVLEQGERLRDMLPGMDEAVFGISERWKDFPAFDFAGAGLDYAAAWFGHAKIIEAVGAFATHNNSEEWFHMNNFFRDIAHCGTVFFACRRGEGYDRTMEAAGYAARLGRPVLVVTDAERDAAEERNGAEHGPVFVQVPPASEFHWAQALTHYVPSCLLAGYIGAMLGERNCRGCLGPWEFAANGAFISTSSEPSGHAGMPAWRLP